jgi:hypothetical protein
VSLIVHLMEGPWGHEWASLGSCVRCWLTQPDPSWLGESMELLGGRSSPEDPAQGIVSIELASLRSLCSELRGQVPVPLERGGALKVLQGREKGQILQQIRKKINNHTTTTAAHFISTSTTQVLEIYCHKSPVVGEQKKSSKKSLSQSSC